MTNSLYRITYGTSTSHYSGSLRAVYGQSDVGTSANDYTLFTQYKGFVEPDSIGKANDYYSLTFKPSITVADFTREQNRKCTIEGETSPNYECLYDTVLMGETVGNATLRNRVEFNKLSTLLCKYNINVLVGACL